MTKLARELLFRHLRQSGMPKEQVEPLLEELDHLQRQIDELKAGSSAESS